MKANIIHGVGVKWRNGVNDNNNVITKQMTSNVAATNEWRINNNVTICRNSEQAASSNTNVAWNHSTSNNNISQPDAHNRQ